ncbi:MAG: hypothetical protein P8M05_08360 [Flavobacteriales bacterium]|nr:hypothetical protein [Flavobacteriales bacterium]
MKATENNGLWDRVFDYQLELNRFAIISAVLLIVGCTGGIATYSGAMASSIQLILILIPTMFCLSTLLAVGPIKRILNLALLSVLIDIIIMTYNGIS